MVTAARDWDWSRLSLVLSDHILSHIAAFPPPNMRFGRDLPGWRWEQDRRFSTKYAYASLVVEASNDSETVDHVLYKCSVAKRVWQGVIAPDKLQGFYAMPFLVWFDRNIRDGGTFTYARENWASRFSVICWLLWKCRCSSLFDENFVGEADLVSVSRQLSINYATAFSSSHIGVGVERAIGYSWREVRNQMLMATNEKEKKSEKAMHAAMI
ncbi:hypothetical protein V6N12_005301 [Hibiscus sabdariffa]|uniref:Reverse transcriptase zinc-binding domain-containing protein n=1 Tax=Hibiscus sabdariffa TaxID=183260 RepID=A0ABR2CPE7_9ROSI